MNICSRRYLWVAVLLAFFCQYQSAFAQVYNVTTFAGSTFGYANGNGATARFRGTTSVAIDFSGNLFVADLGNNRIRKIAPNGTVSTFAGSGVQGYKDGIGVAADFNSPYGLVIDAWGYLYVADAANHRIRKIAPNGTVTTLAGNGTVGAVDGIGTVAQFNYPTALAVDILGNIYVSDSKNNRIRKITPSGFVTTLAGSTGGYADGRGVDAQFNYTSGITVDENGNVYVADAGNSRIRQITPNGVVSTIAGTGECLLMDETGLNASFNNLSSIIYVGGGILYVVDNQMIRKIDTHLQVTTVAGKDAGATDGDGDQATFYSPLGLASNDGGKTLYVADYGNNRIRKVSVTDLPQIARAEYSHIKFSESDANNGAVPIARTITLYSAQWSNIIVTGQTLTLGTHFTISNVPKGLTPVVTKINAYQATVRFIGNAEQHQYSNSLNNMKITFSDAAFNGVTASAIEGLNNVNLSIIYNIEGCNAVTTLAGVGNASHLGSNDRLNGYASDAYFLYPSAVTTDKKGNIYVADGGAIRKINSDGIVSHLTSTRGGLENMYGLTIDKNGNLYGINPTKIYKITSTGASSIVPISGINMTSGSDIAIDNFDNLYISDGVANIYKITLSTGVVKRVNNKDVMAAGIAVDMQGNVFCGGYSSHKVFKVSTNGEVTTVAGSGIAGDADGTALSAQFNQPSGITVDAFGNLFITDYIGARIRKITPDGIVSTVAGSGVSGYVDGNNAQFASPVRITIDSTGNLVIVDRGNYRIRGVKICSNTNNGTLLGYAQYSSTSFQESSSNQGSIGKNQTITLFATQWASSIDDGSILIPSIHYTATGVPAGLTMKITKTSSTTAIISFTGFATAHTMANNTNITLTFENASITSGNVAGVQGLSPVVLSLRFRNPYTSSYSGTTFAEAAANDGTITTTRTVTLNGDTFTTATFTQGTHFSASGVPAGLTVNLTRTSDTTAQIALIGAAAAHAVANNTSFTLSFLNAALVNSTSASSVAGLTPKNFAIEYADPVQTGVAAYSDTLFTEGVANNGQITTTRTVTLSGGATFALANFAEGTQFSTSGVPAGLTLTLTRLSALQVRIGFTGTAAAHALANSTNLALSFLPAAITSGNVAGITGLSPKTLRVNFLNPYTASYSDSTFTEAFANDGSVPTQRTVTLVGTTFTTSATAFVAGTHYNVSGVPSGLTLTVTKLSPTVAQLAFTGNAAAHVTDVNNIRLTFLNAAIQTGNATGVLGLTPKTLAIDFIAPYTATYSAKNFLEGPMNDGAVPTTRLISLFGGDVWVPTVAFTEGVHYTATGVPAGLTLVITRTGATGASISFTGKATAHANANDAALTLTFLNAALASGNAAAVAGLTPAALSIDFRDPELPPPPAPNILGFTPQVGTTGTVVTITGFGFTGTQNVLFGGSPATSFTVVSDSVVTAVVDYGSTGDVVVVNAQGFATLPGFTYVPRPTISSFTPTTGNGGAVVTIKGANFKGTALNGTNWTTTSVYFGGTPAASFSVISPTEIQAVVGAGATGAVRVETLPGNVGVRNGFCYMAPLITAFAPTSASTGTQVVITGSNFTGATAVRFNGRAAASYTVVSDTEIRAFPAANTPITGSVSVTTPQCTDDLATFTFIPAPVIYGFWLSGGTNGDVITIDGINFDNASAVKFGDTVAASFTVVSPTRITAVVGNGKTGAVAVIGPGGVGTRSKFIYYAPGAGRPNTPIITSFTPTEGPDGTVVTINGLNFQGADWFTTAVRIGDAPGGPRTAIIQSMSATRLVVKVNGGATGAIRVYTPAGVTTSTQTFTYFPPPTITAFTPTNGPAGTLVTITGTEFNGVTSVKFGGVVASSYTVVSPTQITATVAAGNTGRVTVVANGGTATSASNFTFPAPPPSPTVTTFTPAVATTGTVVTINGSNFTGATQVTFGGSPAQSFTVVNASRITAVVGGGASGSVQVTTPGGTAGKTGFTYLPKPLPTITSFSPASASPGQVVTILGTYFTGAAQVFMGGASVPFTLHHSGKITVDVPTNAASGAIRVVTPNGVAMRSGFTFIPMVAFSPKGGVESHSAANSLNTVSTLTSVRTFDAEATISAFPNPAQSTVTVRTALVEAARVRIALVNALGIVVWSQELTAQAGVVEQSLDLERLPSGMYMIELRAGTERRSTKVMKQ